MSVAILAQVCVSDTNASRYVLDPDCSPMGRLVPSLMKRPASSCGKNQKAAKTPSTFSFSPDAVAALEALGGLEAMPANRVLETKKALLENKTDYLLVKKTAVATSPSPGEGGSDSGEIDNNDWLSQFLQNGLMPYDFLGGVDSMTQPIDARLLTWDEHKKLADVYKSLNIYYVMPDATRTKTGRLKDALWLKLRDNARVCTGQQTVRLYAAGWQPIACSRMIAGKLSCLCRPVSVDQQGPPAKKPKLEQQHSVADPVVPATRMLTAWTSASSSSAPAQQITLQRQHCNIVTTRLPP